MYRVKTLALSGSEFHGAQQIRLLRIYLSLTTFLYIYGVVFTIWPLHPELIYANPLGGVLAIVLGIAALAWLAVRPDKPAPATLAAIIATPVGDGVPHRDRRGNRLPGRADVSGDVPAGVLSTRRRRC